jgi:hypothetical protein
LRVRLLINRTVACWQFVGEVVEVDDQEAERLIAAQQAERLPQPAAPPEAAMMKQAEARNK